jgi:hypothetical protein
LKLAESLAEGYGRIADECEGPGGIRDQLNLHPQRSYYLMFYYKQNPEEYTEFQRHPYLSDTRQKTCARNIPFTVLQFTMQAKGNKQRLNRIYKRGAVLEYLLTQVVLPEHVAEYLKRVGAWIRSMDVSTRRRSAAVGKCLLTSTGRIAATPTSRRS